jgi:hypothetical protein
MSTVSRVRVPETGDTWPSACPEGVRWHDHRSSPSRTSYASCWRCCAARSRSRRRPAVSGSRKPGSPPGVTQFLDGGRAALAAGARHGPSAHEAESRPRSRSSPAPSARPTWSCACGATGGGLPGFEDLEVIRSEAGLSVVHFCALLGMPRATWYRWRAAVAGGAARPARGRGRRRWWTASSRWPPSTPSSGRPGATARSEGCWPPTASRPARPRYVGPWPAGACCSRSATRPSAASSPQRAGRCSPTRRPGATACGRPTFSELESLAGGIWRMSGVVDY